MVNHDLFFRFHDGFVMVHSWKHLDGDFAMVLFMVNDVFMTIQVMDMLWGS
jgi:hypothetical protein